MILSLVPYAILLLVLMLAFTSELAILSLLRWTGGVFIVAGVLFRVAGV